MRSHVAAYLTTDIGRPFVDLNRAEDDIRRDGVVKTHTCWDLPIYGGTALPEHIIKTLMARYHRPYHRRLAEQALGSNVLIGLDCHTMASVGPPSAPDPGCERPLVSLGNARGASCPESLLSALAAAFKRASGDEVACNVPFSGGYITRSRPGGLRWIQIELSRSPRFSDADKSRMVLQALVEFAAGLAPSTVR